MSELPKKRIWVKILVPLFILGIQIWLIWILLTNFMAFQAGDSGLNRILSLVVSALILFFISLLQTPRFINGLATYERPPKEKKEQKFKVRIIHSVNLNSRYASDIIRKCPKCKFENPRQRITCINCGFHL